MQIDRLHSRRGAEPPRPQTRRSLRPYALRICLLSILGTILTLGACVPADPVASIRTQHKSGNFHATLEPLRALVDADPGNPEANLLLGVALLRVGEAGSAIWPLRVAVNDPNLAVAAGLALTEAALQSRFKDEAIQAADAVLLLDPENVSALEMRIEAYQHAGRTEDVLSEIERVLALDPENKKVLVPRVLAYLSLEKEEEAAEALLLARTALEPEGASEEANPALQTARAKLCVVTGMFTFERGDQEGADQKFEECVTKYPTDPLVIGESVSYFDGTGNAERATEVLEAAYTLESSSALRTQMAQRAERSGDLEKTERLLREEATESGSPNAWFTLGDHFVQREMLTDAVAAFESGVKASPDPSPMLVFAHADTLIQVERFEEARQAARRLEGSALADLIEGRILAAEGNWEAALASFEAGIKLWPNNPGARFLAGQTAEKLGRFDIASSQYREAIRADKGQADAPLALTSLLEAQGLDAQAFDSIGRYVRSFPNDPDGYIRTIRLAQRVGQNEIAKQGLSRLAKIPGQKGVALSISARMVAQRKGAEDAVSLIKQSPLDMREPENAEALAILTANLNRLDREQEAMQAIVIALEAHPECADFHFLMGRQQEELAEAAAAPQASYRRAIELDPLNAESLVALARLEADSGHPELAIDLYDRASLADPQKMGAAIAALRLIAKRTPPAEQERRNEEFLLRHVHSAFLASELAQRVAERGDDPARALALARRTALFDRGAMRASAQAFQAVAQGKPGPEADQAKAILEKMRKPGEPPVGESESSR
ncbi:MAG: tetratricopeptide repeat protein [Myxococcota bacterium]|nr:tetratricopeptide repeat protein [Myxococcota bacterium]